MRNILDLSEEEVKEAWKRFRELAEIGEFYDIMTALRGPDTLRSYSLKATFTGNIRKAVMKSHRYREWPLLSVNRFWLEEVLVDDLREHTHVLEHILCALESMEKIVEVAEPELHDYVKWLRLLAEAVNRLRRIDNRIEVARVIESEEEVKKELENMDNTIEDINRLIQDGFTKGWVYWPEDVEE